MLARLAAGLNRAFRRPGVGGRESDEAYSEWEYHWGQEIVRAYLEPAGDLEGKTILDVGCGLGGKTAAYAEGGARLVVGTDISMKNVAASRAWAQSHAPAVSRAFFAGDAAHLPVADAFFDTVVANDAMEHFSRPEQAFHEMVRVVRPGGAIWVFFTPHFSPLGSHLYDYIYAPWCHLVFGRETLERALERVLRARNPGDGADRARAEAAHIMRRYDTELNHMSIRWFERIYKGVNNLEVAYRELRPARYRFLAPFTRVGLLRECITGFVVCRFRKAGA